MLLHLWIEKVDKEDYGQTFENGVWMRDVILFYQF